MYQNVVVNSDPHLSSANVCYSKISKVVQIRLNRALRRHLSSSQFEEIAGQPLAPPSLPPSSTTERRAGCWEEMGSSCLPGTLPTFWGGQGCG